MDEAFKLEFRHICKSFPGVKALDDISLKVRAGKVHVICGENGAGKSTLVKILNGIYAPDSGEILIDGKPVKIKSPIDAQAQGIFMVYQELSFVPDMTIAENFFCGRWPVTKGGRVDWKAIYRRTQECLDQEGMRYSPTTLMRSLSTSDIQMLEILKAISFDAKILIMDEPSSSISIKETEYLLSKLMELRDRGVSIVYISHKMDEVFRIADDITVIRDGALIATHPVQELTIDQVITMMVGRKLDSQYPKEKLPIGEVALQVEGFTQPGVFENIAFNVRSGEIVGFAGLVGAGRTETMTALFGLAPHRSGTVRIHGKPVRIQRPSDAIRNHMIYVSEDRRRMEIVACRNIQENVTMANLGRYFEKFHWNARLEEREAAQACDRMRVKASSYKDNIMSLSGGNQQKVVLAKWLLCQPDILLMDEPTRGIDVGAKRAIYEQLTDFAREGKAIVLISSELPELIGMCDRIYVMCEGRITGCLGREDFSQETIMRYAIDSERLA
jgi:inositol transport system ATP-binding protein